VPAHRNVGVLPLLGAAGQKDHQPFAIPAEVDAIARSIVQPVLVNTGADTLRVREVAEPILVSVTATFAAA
jgi:hypothetical protein